MDTPRTNLDALERLLAEATPGPWHRDESIWHPDSSVWIEHSASDFGIGEVLVRNDADLIVAAINALPALIATARRAERLEAALEEIAEPVPGNPDWTADDEVDRDKRIARAALKEQP